MASRRSDISQSRKLARAFSPERGLAVTEAKVTVTPSRAVLRCLLLLVLGAFTQRHPVCFPQKMEQASNSQS